LEGYRNRILGNENGKPLSGWKSLTGRGVAALIKQMRPDCIYLTGFGYRYDWAAFIAALRMGIPVWIRMETQDEAVRRPRWKTVLRGLAYRLIYRGVAKAFYIGNLNRSHYERHGIAPSKLVRAPYCTVDRVAGFSTQEKISRRAAMRERLGFDDATCVAGFFGKLIPKKDPGLILEALALAKREKFAALYVGAGELESDLRARAEHLSTAAIFTGFVNQTELADYYLASDIMVLPSRRAGETWGLVVNEALQAGCAVIVSEAAGSAREFCDWERVRVIPEGDAAALARAMEELSKFPRDFDWAREGMAGYSIDAAARAIANEIASAVPLA
ncbi:MAG: glycosyltransferase family 4 protein, partial [Chthoniobacterales bacterium]